MIPILMAAPWVVLMASLPFLLRRRPTLASYPRVARAKSDPRPPRVSIILPVRDDATRVGACLATLLDSEYPDYEILVVDGGSGDGTREIVEVLAARTPGRLRILAAGPAPAAWPWRSWAAWRGSQEASGELLLFTEPGTIHDSELLHRGVEALRRQDADLVSVYPRLTMQGFWERLVMPHIWLMLAARFPSAALVNRNRSPRNAVGSHHFMLFRRAAYEKVGGHGVVGPGTVEDLALPQTVVGAGLRLFLVHGQEWLETQMYRSFDGIAGDWTGAVPPASRTTVAPWAGGFVPWVVAVAPALLFVLPPLALAVGWLIPGWGGLTRWGLLTTGLSLAFWLTVYGWYRIRPAYAVAFPAGALMTTVIFVRSILRLDR